MEEKKISLHPQTYFHHLSRINRWLPRNFCYSEALSLEKWLSCTTYCKVACRCTCMVSSVAKRDTPISVSDPCKVWIKNPKFKILVSHQHQPRAYLVKFAPLFVVLPIFALLPEFGWIQLCFRCFSRYENSQQGSKRDLPIEILETVEVSKLWGFDQTFASFQFS